MHFERTSECRLRRVEWDKSQQFAERWKKATFDSIQFRNRKSYCHRYRYQCGAALIGHNSRTSFSHFCPTSGGIHSSKIIRNVSDIKDFCGSFRKLCGFPLTNTIHNIRFLYFGVFFLSSLISFV